MVLDAGRKEDKASIVGRILGMGKRYDHDALPGRKRNRHPENRKSCLYIHEYRPARLDGGGGVSIIVKGMKMPDCCSECELNYDQISCSVTGTSWFSDTYVLMDFDTSTDKLGNCPLVEISPHGRLIDADELMEHVGRDRLDSRELIYQMIENAQTVIKAEDSE